MKKTICLLLALVMCLSCFVGCPGPAPSGEEEVKPMTAAEFIATVNGVVQEFNDQDLSSVELEQVFAGGVSIEALLAELKEQEGQVRIETRVEGQPLDMTYSLKNGTVYATSEGVDIYATLLEDALVLIMYMEQGGAAHAQANYMLLSSLWGKMEIPEGAMEELETILASVDLSLPLLTEEDVTVDGTTFIIQNSYVTSFFKAAIDSFVTEGTAMESDLAAVKTMLPGLIDNLGLKIAIETKGASVVGYSVSIDANEEFNALIGAPAEIDFKASYAITMTDDGRNLSGIQLDVEVTDMIDLAFAASVTYADEEIETLTVDMDCDLKNQNIISEYQEKQDDMWGNPVEVYYVLQADLSVSLDLTVSPRALLADAPAELRLANGTFTASVVNGQVTADGVPAAKDDAFAASMLEGALGTLTVTVSSEKPEAETNVVTVKVTTPDGEEQEIKVTLTLGKAPGFVAMPDAATNLLYEAYSDEYVMMYDMVSNFSEFTGSFYYFTEDGNTLLFDYYGFGDGGDSFTVMPGQVADPYAHQIVYDNGDYLIYPSTERNDPWW